jgi:hypothetical protein
MRSDTALGLLLAIMRAKCSAKSATSDGVVRESRSRDSADRRMVGGIVGLCITGNCADVSVCNLEVRS